MKILPRPIYLFKLVENFPNKEIQKELEEAIYKKYDHLGEIIILYTEDADSTVIKIDI